MLPNACSCSCLRRAEDDFFGGPPAKKCGDEVFNAALSLRIGSRKFSAGGAAIIENRQRLRLEHSQSDAYDEVSGFVD
ncbi:Uncharacterised protein [Mycobacterium tuberculosis]|nr:Uncharacterised protein [Mycobacterium tuberculosis]